MQNIVLRGWENGRFAFKEWAHLLAAELTLAEQMARTAIIAGGAWLAQLIRLQTKPQDPGRALPGYPPWMANGAKCFPRWRLKKEEHLTGNLSPVA